MSLIQPLCLSTGSQESAITLVFLFLNSSFSLATSPSSVVHTGVKSAGWENSTPHLQGKKATPRSGPLASCLQHSPFPEMVVQFQVPLRGIHLKVRKNVTQIQRHLEFSSSSSEIAPGQLLKLFCACAQKFDEPHPLLIIFSKSREKSSQAIREEEALLALSRLA